MIATLLGNHAKVEAGTEAMQLCPVAKLFTPDAGATWIIGMAEVWGDDDLRLWGGCDLGLGFPEFGYVLLSELEAVRGGLGLPVERDLYFCTRDTMQEYVDAKLLVLKRDLYV